MAIGLVRHGETEWSLSGRHTGRKDLPLTGNGEREARELGPRLRALGFTHAVTSPLQRARRTSELAGFPDAVVDPGLVEWDYGQYEGLTSIEVNATRPGWDLFRDGCPGGETPEHIGARADAAIERLRALPPDLVVFSHGHFLKVLAARWAGWPVLAGGRLAIDTGSIGILEVDRGPLRLPVIGRWNCR